MPTASVLCAGPLGDLYLSQPSGSRPRGVLLENGAWTLKPDHSQGSWPDEECSANPQVHVCELM